VATPLTWEVDPLICPHCGAEMKLIALIDDDEVIDLPAMLRLLAQASIALQAGKILRHLKLWAEHAESARLSRAPPSGNSERNVEPYFDDLPAVSATQSLQAGPFPDYPVTIPRPRDHVERQ
jgi:hypothetical protein